MSTEATFTFDERGLDTISPFHFIIDEKERIVRVGKSLKKMAPELSAGQSLGESFYLQRTSEVLCYSTLRKQLGQLITITLPTHRSVTIRAQAILLTNNQMAIIGAPWFTEMSHMLESGLDLQDFAAHESIADLLLMVQAQASALADATILADAFSALNAKLESHVAQRTEALQEKTRALEQEIKDRQRIEAELRLAQKLESVGQLAAGIAHEINTPIQFIGDNLRFIGDALTPIVHAVSELDAELRRSTLSSATQLMAAVKNADLDYNKEELPKAVAQSLEGIERVATLVRALKEFSHPDSSEHKPADINHAVANALIVARNEYKYVAEAVTECDPHLPLVACNIGEINQVLLNLIVNAGHAIADKKRESGLGRIVVSTKHDNGWVEIRITDNGSGIPEHVQTKIFDPFFTTKPVGKGTGQGLYLAHSIIVKKHGGTIHFETKVNEGTAFICRIPVTSVNAAT
jgi:signal transduction histidine kinase